MNTGKHIGGSIRHMNHVYQPTEQVLLRIHRRPQICPVGKEGTDGQTDRHPGKQEAAKPVIVLPVGKEKVNKVLEKVNLLHRVNHYPQQLSGGQQQRVAIARAVVTDCKLLLADEPTGNLDSVNGIEVMELLSELNHQGTTIVIVTHSQRDAMYAHRVIQLLDGQIVAENINHPLE